MSPRRHEDLQWAEEWGRLVGALSLYCGDAYLAEELAQEALVRYLRSWRSIRDPQALPGWLFRVGINTANSRWRRKSAEERANSRFVSLHSLPSSYEESRDQALLVRQAVAALPRKYKEVLVLRYFYDWSVAQTAAELDLPEGTVKTFTRRALERLRKSESWLNKEVDHERRPSQRSS